MTTGKQKRSIVGRERVREAAAELIKQKNGISPTLKEIGDKLGLSKPTVFWHLTSLKNDGILTWDAGCPRTLRFLTPPAPSAEGSTP